MARTGTAFILGLALGALGVVLLQNLTKDGQEENPDTLLDELSDQLSKLENRIKEASAIAPEI